MRSAIGGRVRLQSRIRFCERSWVAWVTVEIAHHHRRHSPPVNDLHKFQRLLRIDRRRPFTPQRFQVGGHEANLACAKREIDPHIAAIDLEEHRNN